MRLPPPETWICLEPTSPCWGQLTKGGNDRETEKELASSNHYRAERPALGAFTLGYYVKERNSFALHVPALLGLHYNSLAFSSSNAEKILETK